MQTCFANNALHRDGTYWNFHPHCVLDLAPWNQQPSDPDLLEAAQVFVEWVSGPSAQRAAAVNGYRAYDYNFPFNVAGSQVVEEAGADPVKNEGNVPRLQFQDTNVVFEMNKMWKLAKKPVIVCMGIDTSLSMASGNDMQDVKDAALVGVVVHTVVPVAQNHHSRLSIA